MLHDAATNRVDFTTLNLREKKSRNKLKWIMSYMARENQSKLTELQLFKQLAVLDYHTERETIEMHWENAAQLYTSIKKVLLPGLREVEKKKVDPTQELEEAYRRAFPESYTAK